MRKLLSFLFVFLTSCSLMPDGYDVERKKLENYGAHYAQDFAERKIPELSSSPSSKDLLYRAFIVNGELESAYFEWVANMEQVREAAAYPSSPFQFNFQYMFSKDRMKGWDRTTVGLQPSSMSPLSLPQKVRQKAQVMLQAAQSVGEKFLQLKFNIQKELLSAWIDYGLMAEKIRVQEANLAILRILERSAQQRFESGQPQVEFLKANLEISGMSNDLANMKATLKQMLVRINGMLVRDLDAPLNPPSTIPVLGRLQATDAEILSFGVELSPELRSFSLQVSTKEKELELASLEFLPDIMPMASVTGTVSQMIGATFSLSSSYQALQANYDRIAADLKGARALYRAKRNSLAAELVATIVAMRNVERNIRALEAELIPAAKVLVSSSAQYYASGVAELMPYLDNQRMLLELEVELAEARAEHEKQLLELETILGRDLVPLS